jgi:hypothetical protein
MVVSVGILILRHFRFDGALDLLNRHSGIVWGPGRFAGLLRGGSARGSGNPSSPPYFMGGVQARPSLVSRSGLSTFVLIVGGLYSVTALRETGGE